MPCGEKGAMDRRHIRLSAKTSSQDVPVRARAKSGPHTIGWHWATRSAVVPDKAAHCGCSRTFCVCNASTLWQNSLKRTYCFLGMREVFNENSSVMRTIWPSTVTLRV